MTVLDARRGAYPPPMFVDATHLGGLGAIALSRAVGTMLKADLSRPAPPSPRGWIELNAPADDPDAEVDFLLEDIEQSKKLLHLVGDGGRSIR